MENNNDNNYNERVNSNKEFINNYGETNHNNSININMSTNIGLVIRLIATIVCFAIFVVRLQNFILFLVSMIFVILVNKKFFKVLGRFIFLSFVVILIAFGLCLFMVATF